MCIRDRDHVAGLQFDDVARHQLVHRPVSYTPLDVYKRQGLGTAGADYAGFLKRYLDGSRVADPARPLTDLSLIHISARIRDPLDRQVAQ